MQAKEVCKRVGQMILPVAESLGLTLWDVEFEKEGGQWMLTVFIDHEDGVDVDQCETVSRALDPMLDAKDFDALPPYTLCVSSAGLERSLKKQEHFDHCMGQEIELKFYKAIDGAKTAEGTLLAYDNGAVTILANEKETKIEAADIALVRLKVIF